MIFGKIYKRLKRQSQPHSPPAEPQYFKEMTDLRNIVMAHGEKLVEIPKIAFLVKSTGEIDHYSRIWRHLDKKDYKIILSTQIYDYQYIKTFLIENGIDFSLFEESMALREQYTILVYWGPHTEVQTASPGLGKHLVRYVLQAFAMEQEPINRKTRLFLCPGEESEKALKAFCPDFRCVQIGYPRLDDYFLNLPIPQSFNRFISKKKKTLLFFPTHNDEFLGEQLQLLVDLASEFNVVIKPHPSCFVEKFSSKLKEIAERFPHIHVYDQRNESAIGDWALFKIADYICVNSKGSLLAVAYLGKMAIIFKGSDFHWIDPMLLDSFLVLEELSRSHFFDTIHNKELVDAKAQKQNMLRSQYFAPYEGNAGKKAADILQQELYSLCNLVTH